MSNKILSLIALSAMFMNSCQEVVEDPFPPEPPTIVKKSLPAAIVERGVDSHNLNINNPEANSIIVMWHPNSEDDMDSYSIFRTRIINEEKEPIEFERISTISATNNDTVFIDENVTTYERFYYYMVAVDMADNNSTSSDTVSYMVLRKPEAFTENVNMEAQSVVFSWVDSQSGAHIPNLYLIRLNNILNETVWTCLLLNPDFTQNGEPVSISFSPTCEECIEHRGIDGYLQPGKYYWKLKALRMGSYPNDSEMDIAGAESDWVEIFIMEY